MTGIIYWKGNAHFQLDNGIQLESNLELESNWNPIWNWIPIGIQFQIGVAVGPGTLFYETKKLFQFQIGIQFKRPNSLRSEILHICVQVYNNTSLHACSHAACMYALCNSHISTT